jgi:hypothetical protein
MPHSQHFVFAAAQAAPKAEALPCVLGARATLPVGCSELNVHALAGSHTCCKGVTTRA